MVNNKTADEKIALVLTLMLAIPAIKYTIVQSFRDLYQYNTYANIIIYIILMMLIIPIISIVVQRRFLQGVISFIIISILLLVTFLFYPENRINILSHILRIYTVSYVFFIISYSLYDFKVLLKYLTKSSYIIISFGVIMFINTILLGAVGFYETEYNMSLSYYILIPTIIMLFTYLENKKNMSLIFFLLGFLIIIGMGSRGPLLSIVLFYVLYKIKTIKTIKELIKNIYIYILPISIFLIYKDHLVTWVYNFLESINIHSRTLYLLSVGEVTTSSGRDDITSNVLSKLINNPILGIGFLGDISSHNFFIETLLFFGVILGTIIILILIYLIINALLYKGNKELEFVLLILLAHSIPDAALNLTIWGKDVFWIFIGISLTSLKFKKN